MQLDSDELAQLVGDPDECVFTWTNRESFPVGVVVAFAAKATVGSRTKRRWTRGSQMMPVP